MWDLTSGEFMRMRYGTKECTICEPILKSMSGNFHWKKCFCCLRMAGLHLRRPSELN